MFVTGGIDQLIRDIGLVLSITFVVQMIGAIAGTIVRNLTAFHTGTGETGLKNG
jgi:hypothetical protein